MPIDSSGVRALYGGIASSLLGQPFGKARARMIRRGLGGSLWVQRERALVPTCARRTAWARHSSPGILRPLSADRVESESAEGLLRTMEERQLEPDPRLLERSCVQLYPRHS